MDADMDKEDWLTKTETFMMEILSKDFRKVRDSIWKEVWFAWRIKTSMLKFTKNHWTLNYPISLPELSRTFDKLMIFIFSLLISFWYLSFKSFHLNEMQQKGKHKIFFQAQWQKFQSNNSPIQLICHQHLIKPLDSWRIYFIHFLLIVLLFGISNLTELDFIIFTLNESLEFFQEQVSQMKFFLE